MTMTDFFLDGSVREETDNDPIQSDEAEAEVSPTKSPTTPKNVKCKNSSGKRHSVLDFPAMLLSLTDMKTRAPASHADKSPAPFTPAKMLHLSMAQNSRVAVLKRSV